MNISRLATAALIVTGVLVSVAPAGAPMGSPTAYLGAGNWGVGAEYGYGQMDLEASGTVAEVTGPLDISWAQHFKMDNLKSNMVFGTIAYGLMDTWDIFARLGATDAKDTIVAVARPAFEPRRGRAIWMAVSDSPGEWGPAPRSTNRVPGASGDCAAHVVSAGQQRFFHRTGPPDPG